MKRPQTKSLLTPRTGAKRPRSRVWQGRRWMLTGWALFALSMFLPALWVQIFDKGDWWQGWVCAWLVVLALWESLHHNPHFQPGAYLIAFALANIVMLLSPLMLRSRKWPRPARLIGNVLLLLSCLQVTSWFFNLLHGSDMSVRDIGVGYYVWSAGFWTLFAGVLRLQSTPKISDNTATIPTNETELQAARNARYEQREHLHV